jgi:hypothetical protein
VLADLAQGFLNGGLREIDFYVSTEFVNLRVRCFVLKILLAGESPHGSANMVTHQE